MITNHIPVKRLHNRARPEGKKSSIEGGCPVSEGKPWLQNWSPWVWGWCCTIWLFDLELLTSYTSLCLWLLIYKMRGLISITCMAPPHLTAVIYGLWGAGPWKMNQISVEEWELMNKSVEAETGIFKRKGVIKKSLHLLSTYFGPCFKVLYVY